MKIAIENPLTEDALGLIEGSEAALRAVYTPDECFAYSPQELAEPNVRFYVARDVSGVPMGCVAAADMGDYVEVKRLFVRPEAQGTGLGRKLMAHLEAEAVEAGHKLVRLETGDLLAAACALYERIGYTRRGPFGDYEEAEASTFMEKAL
ncbi:MAG: GNAT family N-acetyltransferase [Pseudomonadota bacterium]